jgi:hypothetical protein
MKYALVNGERQEAKPGLSGKCPGCKNLTIAKCGIVRVQHWSHKGKLICDPWREGETEWHRAWKGQFPKEWQEVYHQAENGNTYRADVKIDQGYVIEFQHSPIKAEVRQSREAFYEKMIWIIDGTRRLRDKDKFINVWEQSINVWKQANVVENKAEVRRPYFFDECALLRDWGVSKVLVFFDFGDDILWGLLQKTADLKGRYILKINRKELISYLLSERQVSFEALLQGLNELLILKEKLFSVRQSSQQQQNYSFYKPGRRRMTIPLKIKF